MSIGIFDSGLGGAMLSSKIKKKLNNHDLIFVADLKNFPYGNKSSSQLKKIVLDLTNFIISKRDVKVIIIACNTASTAALNDIKAITNIPIISPISLIMDNLKFNKFKKVAMIATSFTIKSNFYQTKIKQLIPQTSILCLPTPDLAKMIEDSFLIKGKIDKQYIKSIAKEVNQSSVNALILGSTHYSAIREDISLYLDDNIKIIDLGDLLLDKLKNMALINQIQEQGDLKIFLTKESKEFNISISKLFSGEKYSVNII